MSAIPQSTELPERTGRVVRSTLIVMGGLGSSILIGLIRQRVIASTFGTSSALDAYTAANGIPELLFTTLSGGALAFAFIPVYSQVLGKGDHQGGNTLVSQVINTIFLLSSSLALILAFIAPTLVKVSWGIGPHFPTDVQQMTSQLMRILLLSTLVFAISSIFTGVLHSHQHFLLPAIAPSVYSLGIIFGALLLAPSMGISGLAWGAVLGALFHFTIQIPGLIRHQVRWHPILGWSELLRTTYRLRIQIWEVIRGKTRWHLPPGLNLPGLMIVAVLMAPRVIDLFMARASIDWINANLGSGMGEGRVSSLRYAFQLMNTPWTLIGTAIGIAIFPTMVILASDKDVNAQRSALSGALRAILTLALPAAVALIVLGRPIIGVLFEGGEFNSQSTELVYFALQFYTLALISQSVLEVVVRAFAAQKDTFTPLLVSMFTTILNVKLAMYLARPRIEGGLEHGGLALANGVAVGIESLVGLTILHFRWGGIDARRILLDAGKAFMAAAAMGGVIWGFNALLEPGRLVLLFGGGALGGMTYFALAYLLGIKEIRTLPLAMLEYLKQKPSRAA